MTKLLMKIALKNSKDERESLGSLSGIFGIVANAFLCVFKFIVGSVSGSVSIVADAFNNLADAGSSIISLGGTKLANKPVDKDHPFGHGRMEYISALVISFLIFLMGFNLGKSSIEKIIHPEDVKFSVVYVVILAVAIGVKLYMAYLNNVLYKKTGNINLKAVKQDSLNDCIATGATIVALLISALTPFKLADGIIGLGVAIVIFISGIDIVKEVLGSLLGKPPEKETVDGIKRIMLSHPEIIGVHDLMVHDYGPGRIVASAHAEVRADCDVVEIHDIIDVIEKEIGDEMNIIICIHMDPIVVDDEEVNRYKDITEGIIKGINSEYTFHDFKMVKGNTHTNLIFDLVVPHKMDKTKREIVDELQNEFNKLDEVIFLVVTVEHSFIG